MNDISYWIIGKLTQLDLTPNSAIVFDIDNTLIHSNGNGIIPIINVFNHVKSIGIIPILITNRIGNQQSIDFTQNQLKQCGIEGYKSLYFRHPEKEDNPYRYKERARRSVYERGMNVIMSIGDQPWDIGNYGGIGVIIPIL